MRQAFGLLSLEMLHKLRCYESCAGSLQRDEFFLGHGKGLQELLQAYFLFSFWSLHASQVLHGEPPMQSALGSGRFCAYIQLILKSRMSSLQSISIITYVEPNRAAMMEMEKR